MDEFLERRPNGDDSRHHWQCQRFEIARIWQKTGEAVTSRSRHKSSLRFFTVIRSTSSRRVWISLGLRTERHDFLTITAREVCPEPRQSIALVEGA